MVKTKIMTVVNTKPNSFEYFKPHLIGWKILGISINIDKDYRIAFILYSCIINLLVTICYPLHLCLQIFRSDTQADNIKNIAISFSVVACSLKFVLFATKLSDIQQLEQILRKLDERINDGSELIYYRHLQRRLRIIAMTFVTIYVLVGIMGELSSLFRAERNLLYPAWFPFNWKETTLKFYIANIYQFVGLLFLIVQDFANDCFPAMALCMLSGHIKLLSIRVANIGYDDKSLEDNEKELTKCVVDQNNLYDLFTTIENIISLPILVQFCVTAANICVGIAALFFYASTPLDFVYFFVYFLALPLQIFPTCYYGTDCEYLFEQLHKAVFANNWMNQSAKFKKHLLLFTERSLKQHMPMAGGMIRIHLRTFVSTCRGSYSLFAILVRMK